MYAAWHALFSFQMTGIRPNRLHEFGEYFAKLIKLDGRRESFLGYHQRRTDNYQWCAKSRKPGEIR